MDPPRDVRPVALLLLPRTLEDFILREQAEDLLARASVLAIDPPRVPYGTLLRLPAAVGERVAARQGRRIVRDLAAQGMRPQVAVIFHPVQVAVAQAVLAGAGGDGQLWYGRWDRYEHAYDAGPDQRTRLEVLHRRAAQASALTFVASEELARLEQEVGREATLVPLAADTFPAPDPAQAVVAVSLGHLGWRTDWALLRAVAERIPGLVLLLIGDCHEAEVGEDEDFRWCRTHPAFVWLGRRSDEEAARLVLCADAGIVPFRVEPFNDAGLPYRILKYARLGRRTVTPDLAGVRTWARAVVACADPDAFAAALRAEAGRRTSPDLQLREWALAQTARSQNTPLHERLDALGL